MDQVKRAAQTFISVQFLMASAAAFALSHSYGLLSLDVFEVLLVLLLWGGLYVRWAVHKVPVHVILLEMSIWIASRYVLQVIALTPVRMEYDQVFGITSVRGTETLGDLPINNLVIGAIACLPVSLLHLLRRRLEHRATRASETHSPAPIFAVLYSRAGQLRATSWAVLFFIVTFLSGGIWLFFRADQFSALNEVGGEIRAIKTTIAEIAVLNSSLKDHEKELQALGTPPDLANVAGPYVPRDRAVDNERRMLRQLSTTLSELNAHHNVLDRIRELANSPAFYSDSSSFIVTTISARIGIVILLIFLVQLLASLYRYILRLSVFYETRGDILSIKVPEVGLAELLTPSQVDFGESPEPLSEHVTKSIVDLARTYKARTDKE